MFVNTARSTSARATVGGNGARLICDTSSDTTAASIAIVARIIRSSYRSWERSGAEANRSSVSPIECYVFHRQQLHHGVCACVFYVCRARTEPHQLRPVPRAWG